MDILSYFFMTVHVKSWAVSLSGEQIDVAHSCMGVHFCAAPCVWGTGVWWWKLMKVLVRYVLLTKKKKKYDWSCVGEIFVGMVCHLNEKEKKKQLVFKVWGKSLNVFDIEWRKEWKWREDKCYACFQWYDFGCRFLHGASEFSSTVLPVQPKYGSFYTIPV